MVEDVADPVTAHAERLEADVVLTPEGRAGVLEFALPSAAKVVMTVSADTLNRTGPHKISPLKSLSNIVAEQDIPAAKLRAYKAAGIEVLCA
ncbi:MAG: hypothetical protein LC795_00410 [Acidobacteria bacterium]|nr:hypothetical protein [Acidobacteriota bacterium]